MYKTDNQIKWRQEMFGSAEVKAPAVAVFLTAKQV